MRVLITGVSGASGRAVSRLALAAGHEVVGLTDRPHQYLDPRIEVHVAAAPGISAWTRALAGVDVVLHIADTGADHLATAVADRTDGATAVRVVLLASAADDRGPRADLEAAGARVLVVRAAPLVGRRVDSVDWSELAILLGARDGEDGQVLHHDDLDRFLLHSITSMATGEVALAAPGTVSPGHVREAMTAIRVKGDLARSAGQRPPRLDPTPLPDFSYGWTASEAVDDLARGLVGRVRRRGHLVEQPGRFTLRTDLVPANIPPSDGGRLVPAGPSELQGEFDTLLDPRFPVLTCTNTSEALPRPLTPMTIDLQVGAIRVANEVMGEMLALEGVALEQQTSLVVAVLGHTPYINASVGVNVVENMPGWDVETVRRDVYGHIPQDIEFRPEGGPPMPEGLAGRRAMLTAARRTIGRARKFRDEAELLAEAARREALGPQDVAALDDAALHTRALLWRDRLAHAWTATSIGAMLYGAAGAMHARGKEPEEVRIDVERLESARTMLAVEALASVLRGDAELIALARSGDVDALCAASGRFARVLDEQLAAMGHRGPGECELENPTFADRPAMLVASASGAALSPASVRDAVRPPRSRSARMVVGATLARERARDAVVRYTRCLRLVVREQGRRLAERGVLDHADDVFYLTLDEAFAQPAAVKDLVTRRRAERASLKTIRMPDVVVGTWQPEADGEVLAVGQSISGLGVSTGMVEGRVRVLSSPDDDIEPGDVLVAAVTDVGHTAMFGYAAAVVTDIGGSASHAAIVAREFGIPCVVDTKDATGRLPDGAWVRVDGGTGQVTLLAPDPQGATPDVQTPHLLA